MPKLVYKYTRISQYVSDNGIFKSKSDEILLVCIPFILLLVFLSNRLINVLPTLSFHFEQAVVTNIFFFNATHQALTVVLLACFPEVRKAIFKKRSNLRFILQASAIFLFTYILMYSNQVDETQKTFLKFITFFWVLSFTLYHFYIQIYGISSIYTQKIKSSCPKIQIPYWVEKIEKIGFHIYIGFKILLISLPMFCKTFDVTFLLNYQTIKYGCLIGVLVGFILILLPVHFLKIKIYHPKILFLSRLLIYAFFETVFSTYSILVMSHGVEYVLIYKQMLSKTIANQRKIKFISILCVLMYAIFCYISYYISQINSQSALLALGPSLFFLHFYVDRKLFRMRDIRVRHNIMPLLN